MKDTQNPPFIIVDLNSGRYVQQHSVGHEKYNLVPNPIDGLYYGYCPPFGGVGIDRLDASKHAASKDDVMVIYTRKIGKGPDREVIAFTDRATVFRKEQSGKGMARQISINGKTVDCGYHIVSENLYNVERDSNRFRIHCGDYNTYMFRKQRVFSGTYPSLDKRLVAWLRECLLRMNQDDSLYQEQLEDSISVLAPDSFSTREPEFLTSTTGCVVKKNPLVSMKAVAASGFKCAYDPTHRTFMRSSGLPYMEGHHLIPCTAGNAERYWKRFGRNIDCVENIVALCPTCHRRIHFGSEVERAGIIEKLYHVQSEKLRSVGLEVGLEEILGLYEIANKRKK